MKNIFDNKKETLYVSPVIECVSFLEFETEQNFCSPMTDDDNPNGGGPSGGETTYGD
ncbi:MAG: hypothetical protein LBB41_00020 [Prevotellaceae bacterium]|jgi:hypothetical protein|nr:hypothetical protein [Prevotellaceae bacterium]